MITSINTEKVFEDTEFMLNRNSQKTGNRRELPHFEFYNFQDQTLHLIFRYDCSRLKDLRVPCRVIIEAL
jgi:hypothetical protein